MEKENEKTKTVPPDWELNPFDLQDKLSMFNMDMFKVVPDMEKEFAEIRAQRPKGSNHEMRNEIKRLETFDTFKTYSSWSPDEMANSGFYFTGIKNSIQCFCCGLVMCTNSLEKTPHVKHQELKPECDFLKGKEVGNISKYELKVQRNSIMPPERREFYKAEETRLESFHDWPTYAKADVAALASAGFFFTGEKDIVQWFCCAGSLAFWETEDDPWKEHAKWFPEDEAGMKTISSQMFPKKGAVHDPSANMDERKIFEAYLHYTLQKPRQESVKVAAVMLSCGDLALEGLFTKQFEFTEESLRDAGIDSGDVLALGLMSKFTTQMLFPVYKFFHVSFQEYLAAKRLSDHFESDTEEQLKRGWCYLAQINTYFKHFLHFDRGVSELASALPKFENMKVLNLETQDIQDKGSAQIFAQALESLVNLKELHLPLGNGMKAALPTVLEQLQHIRQLQVLTIGVILEDHSLYQLAKLSKESFLQSVQKLDLEINHGVTDAGWRDFFQTLDNLPHLKDLLVSRHYSKTLKPHASTVRAFVQCVSRLPSLMLIVMYGWLLDSEDLNMFNQMKRQHPQSQCLKLIWQWVLPFSPQILRETF
nr:PREDICTED: baculoviral IAP repeat-containing protein 1a-like [Lepisosteus oculatus]